MPTFQKGPYFATINGTMAILEIKNLTVSFDGKPVLKDINLRLEAGENLSVIGPNGAGKTVLLKALLGEVKHHGSVQ